MEQVIIHIDTSTPEGKAELKNLRIRANRVNHMTVISESKHKKELREALLEVKHHLSGEKQMRGANNLLKELQDER